MSTNRTRDKLRAPLPEHNPVPHVVTDDHWAAVVDYINNPEATLKHVAALHGVSVERVRASVHYAARALDEVKP